jgi:hypothetical protein
VAIANRGGISFVEKKMMYQSYFMSIVPVSKGDEITKKLYPLRVSNKEVYLFLLNDTQTLK